MEQLRRSLIRFLCAGPSGEAPEDWLFDSAEKLIEIVRVDLGRLEIAGRAATYGDTRCIIFGHLTRIAIWQMRAIWDRFLPTAEKIAAFRNSMIRYGEPDDLARLAADVEPVSNLSALVPEIASFGGGGSLGAVPF